MGAITALQSAQQYQEFATADAAEVPSVDFAMLARSMGCAGFTPEPHLDSLNECLEAAYRHPGPAVVDVKVYFGPEKYAALDAFGRWNVGPWSPAVEAIWEGKAKPE
jgi:3D-(3,5/4)-trihydroxycyclohexane-1,2-dione acylhydrolase (decyclizing)